MTEDSGGLAVKLAGPKVAFSKYADVPYSDIDATDVALVVISGGIAGHIVAHKQHIDVFVFKGFIDVRPVGPRAFCFGFKYDYICKSVRRWNAEGYSSRF